MRTVQVERMRPEEFLAAKKECSVAYLPMGPVEWHGPHMPFGTDPLNAQAIALGAAERLGGVVFPTLFCGTERARTPEQVKWMGFEDEHQYVVGMDVPKNTVRSCYFPEEVFGVILREYLLQILAMDFDVVVMVNGHGADGQVVACQRLARELSATTSTKVLYCFGFDMAGGEKLPRGHANISETSMQMYVSPDCVRLDALPPRDVTLKTCDWGIADSELFQGGRPDHDVQNDPRDATAELGKEYIERSIAYVIASVQKAQKERQA